MFFHWFFVFLCDRCALFTQTFVPQTHAQRAKRLTCLLNKIQTAKTNTLANEWDTCTIALQLMCSTVGTLLGIFVKCECMFMVFFFFFGWMCNLILSFVLSCWTNSVLKEKMSSRVTTKYDFFLFLGFSLSSSLHTFLFCFARIALCFGYFVQSSIAVCSLNVDVYRAFRSRWFSIYYFIVIRVRRQ